MRSRHPMLCAFISNISGILIICSIAVNICNIVFDHISWSICSSRGFFYASLLLGLPLRRIGVYRDARPVMHWVSPRFIL